MNTRVFAAALMFALTAAACGGVTSPSNNVVENVSGTVPVGGAGPVHPFNVSNSGEYTITVTSLTPATNTYFTMLFGQSVGGQCSAVQVNSFAAVNVAGSAGAIQQGSYCVQIADSGFFTTAETYSMKISHP